MKTDQTSQQLEERIAALEQRNKRVELDKAWETSTLRKVAIIAVTYCVVLVKKLAKKHSKTPAQIVLRWAQQRGTIPIPRSSYKRRLLENFDVFDFKLSAEDVKKLEGLDKKMPQMDTLGWWGFSYF